MNKYHCLTILLFIIATLSVEAKHSAETESWLQRLDSVIQQRQVFDVMKAERLTEMYKKKASLRSHNEIVSFNTQMYDEYYVFDSDSAMSCVNQNIEIARQSGNESLVTEWRIKQSFILSATGLLKESLDVMESLDISDMPNSVKIEYFSQMVYLFSHFGQYTGSGELQDHYIELERRYNDSLHCIVTPADPQYLWFDVWYSINNGQQEGLQEQLNKKVSLSSLTTRDDAMAAYALACVYRQNGNEDMFMRCLAMSGIADIRASNKDIASLQELAEVLIDKGEILRAYNYINVCLQISQEYHNRVRAVSISRVYERILQGFLDRDEVQRERLKKTNVALIVMIVLLIAAIAFVVSSLLRLRRSRRRLHEVNKELKRRRSEIAAANQHLKDANESLVDVNEKMKKANEQLRESNLVKEEYVGYVFAICSSYISKLEELRKDINRKAKAKMLNEILTMTDKQTVVQDELKEFYQNFDAIFLRLYPAFVEEFNALLDPEERIVPRKGELLNTDLRIYALVRLGITDSVKISEFLHCSPQTVYNNRLKIRNKTKLSKEDLMEALRKIGCATD